MPELSIAPWPDGSHSSANTIAGAASITLVASHRSTVMLTSLSSGVVGLWSGRRS